MDSFDAKQQTREISNSLKVLVETFKSCQSQYRIIGSIIIVAHKNKVFRRIGDIDILLDTQSKECVFAKLKEKGFVFHNKHWLAFRWVEVEKEDFLGLTFFLTGEFTKDSFRHSLSPGIELRIHADYLQPTKYTFQGISFLGIPLSSTMAGIHQAFFNPKRSLDKEMLRDDLKRGEVKPYGNINLYVAGVKLPYVYDIFSFFYNLYGGIRVRLGKKYEAWE